MGEPVFLRDSLRSKTTTPQDLLVACSKAYDAADHISLKTDCDSLTKEQLKLLLRASEHKNKCLERVVEELRLAFDREFRIKLGQKLGRVLHTTVTSPKRAPVTRRDNPTPRLSYKCREEKKEEEGDEDDGIASPDEWFDIFRFR
jgi:hypothetical protein